jgi:disulfide bond formation protein DsbB
MARLTPLTYAILAALASAAMLGAAHAFERFGGYEPCQLCLRQREVYWIALPAGLVGAALLLRRPDLGRAVPTLLALIFLTGFGVAAYHAGVEWKWWPAPSTCGGGGAASADEVAAMLRGGPVRYVLCDEAAWVMGGLSMAGWNALASLALAGLGFAAALRGRRNGGFRRSSFG